MGIFDFEHCVVVKGKVYCADSEGNLYAMALPERVKPSDCPEAAIKGLLAMREGRNER